MRWQILYRTSPSGKTLYVCTICGRSSATPDKNCPSFEQYVPGCPDTKSINCGDFDDDPPPFTGKHPISNI